MYNANVKADMLKFQIYKIEYLYSAQFYNCIYDTNIIHKCLFNKFLANSK